LDFARSMRVKPGVSLCQKKMEIRRIVDSDEHHARLSHILGGVLSCDSIVRSALGVRAKKKFTTPDKG
jgi:hypothetical protein